MESFFQSVAGWPWYAWVAIIAIAGGCVVRCVVGRPRTPR